jgi:RimJ/RimL family protein N-acetyltransferase
MLTTERLILRPFRDGDAPAVARLLSTPRMSEHTLRFDHPYTVETARRWIGQHNTWAERDLHLQWAIVLPDDTVIGTVSFALERDPRQGDLGYWIGVDYWNHGYATEAVRAVIAHGFDSLRLERIQASCFASNVASTRVLEKAGLCREALLPQHIEDNGVMHDVLQFGLSRP